MKPEVLQLLLAADDSTYFDLPLPDFDYFGVDAKVDQIQHELERLVGRTFVYDAPQDASYFGELAIQVPGEKPHYVDTVIGVRFSWFGNLFTTWSNPWAEQLPDATVQQIIETVQRHGFVYVSKKDLDEPYTGINPPIRDETWWYRFFDYL